MGSPRAIGDVQQPNISNKSTACLLDQKMEAHLSLSTGCCRVSCAVLNGTLKHWLGSEDWTDIVRFQNSSKSTRTWIQLCLNCRGYVILKLDQVQVPHTTGSQAEKNHAITEIQRHTGRTQNLKTKCLDRHQECHSWAAAGLCQASSDRYLQMMRVSCCASCAP